MRSPSSFRLALIAAIVIGTGNLAHSDTIKSHTKWRACADNVLDGLMKKGERKHGAPSAFVGVSGSGAHADTLKKCGYEPMTTDVCNDIFVNVYLDCYDPINPKTEFFSVEEAWIYAVNPRIFNRERLLSLCSSPHRVSREDFGRLMCRGK